MGKKRKRSTEEDDGRIRKKANSNEEVPDGIYHYKSIAQVPWDAQHYFRQRHQIFSLYKSGIWLTESAWFGVTQESVAVKIATHIAHASPSSKSIILDAFCGAGGNTIAFARSGRWKRVYAIEKDAATLECAMQNARVYGVYDKITWFLGDCFELLGLLDGGGGGEGEEGGAVEVLRTVVGGYGVLFGSPPWGGPGYKDAAVFDLSWMEPYSLRYMFARFGRLTKSMAFYLPRTSDLGQIAECVEDGETAQVVHYCTDGGSRALCAYLGEWGDVYVRKS